LSESPSLKYRGYPTIVTRSLISRVLFINQNTSIYQQRTTAFVIEWNSYRLQNMSIHYTTLQQIRWSYDKNVPFVGNTFKHVQSLEDHVNSTGPVYRQLVFYLMYITVLDCICLIY